MAGHAELLRALSALLSYPRADFAERVAGAVRVAPAELRTELEAFAKAIEPLDLAAREELFCTSFDLNPNCALEIGWHLFGEDYHRGQLLVRLRGELARLELPETVELPDHLTSVLLLLAAYDEFEAARFADACVVPALEPMVKAQRDAGNPYLHVLSVIQQTVGALVPVEAEEVDRG